MSSQAKIFVMNNISNVVNSFCSFTDHRSVVSSVAVSSGAAALSVGASFIYCPPRSMKALTCRAVSLLSSVVTLVNSVGVLIALDGCNDSGVQNILLETSEPEPTQDIAELVEAMHIRS